MLHEVQLEPARIADAVRMGRMSRALIEQGLTWRWRSRSIARKIRDPETEVLVAREGVQIVGFAIMEFAFLRHEAHLLLLAVEPSRRRRGLGRGLVRWLEKIARAGGIASIQLELRARNHGARRFYRQLGYEEVALLRGYYQQREDAMRLVTTLRRSSVQDVEPGRGPLA